MPADCTITLTEVKDEYNEDTLVVNVVPDRFRVSPNQLGVTWDVVNGTNAKTLVKIRFAGARNSPLGGARKPHTDVTPKAKVDVPANSTLQIVVNIDAQAPRGHVFKYCVVVGKVVAVDPELEIAP